MKKIYILLLGLWLAACETVVEIDIPQEAPRLVANAFITPDSLIVIRLSQSKYILDTASLKPVTGAQLRIYENDQLKETLLHRGKGMYESSFKPQAGSTYSLQAEAEGFESIASETFIRPAIPIEQLTHTIIREPTGSYYNEQLDTTLYFYDDYVDMKLTLTDPAAQQNYYEISASIAYTYYYEEVDEDFQVIGKDTMKRCTCLAATLRWQAWISVLKTANFMVTSSSSLMNFSMAKATP
jgi:hypothetical protein